MNIFAVLAAFWVEKWKCQIKWINKIKRTSTVMAYRLFSPWFSRPFSLIKTEAHAERNEHSFQCEYLMMENIINCFFYCLSFSLSLILPKYINSVEWFGIMKLLQHFFPLSLCVCLIQWGASCNKLTKLINKSTMEQQLDIWIWCRK